MEIRYNDYQTGWSGIVKGDIENFIGRSLSTVEENLFNLLLPKFESYICSGTKRQFKVLSGTDVYYEKYKIKPIHFFYNYPVSEVKKIKFDDDVVYDASQSDNTLVLNQDFEYDENRIAIYNFADLTEPKNITVYYQIAKFWGEDVRLALIEEIANYITSLDFGGREVRNLSISGLSVNFGERDRLKEIIRRYRKVSI